MLKLIIMRRQILLIETKSRLQKLLAPILRELHIEIDLTLQLRVIDGKLGILDRLGEKEVTERLIDAIPGFGRRQLKNGHDIRATNVVVKAVVECRANVRKDELAKELAVHITAVTRRYRCLFVLLRIRY